MTTLLFNWYYHREDLTRYILDGFSECRIVFINYAVESEVPAYLKNYSNVEFIYWNDFPSPYKLLHKIKPTGVIFYDIEAFNQLALNIAARHSHIPTFVLQHGLRSGYEISTLSETEGGRLPVKISNTTIPTFRFLANAFRPSDMKFLPALLKFIVSRKFNDIERALSRNKFPLRNADYYIEFSRLNAGYHIERDELPLSKFIFTGNPEFDKYALLEDKSDKVVKNVLLIDCPFETYNGDDIPRYPIEQKNNYILALNKKALEDNYQLRVKLHPKSFGVNSHAEGDNIIYYRESDLAKLISEASLVIFVHYSSITPVILNYKKCIYLNVGGNIPRKLFETSGLKSTSLAELKSNNLDSLATRVDPEKIAEALYKLDGLSVLRVKNAILERCIPPAEKESS